MFSGSAAGVALGIAGCGGGAALSSFSSATSESTSQQSMQASASQVRSPAGRQQSVDNWKPFVPGSGEGAVKQPSGTPTDAERAELRSLQSGRSTTASETARSWNAGAAVRWNEIARSLVAKYKTAPPVAARQYAAMSVSQYDALVAANKIKQRVRRAAPASQDSGITPLFAAESDSVYPSMHAVLSGASAQVLAKFYPSEAQFIAGKAREAEESRLYAGVNFRSDITDGDALGRAVADKVLVYVAKDGADRQLGSSSTKSWWNDKKHADKGERRRARGNKNTTWPPPEGDPNRWTGTNPLLPQWGEVRTWLVSSVKSQRPPAPPALGTPQFEKDLAEVRQISATRTPEQLRIAKFWADGAGTSTPPGHWNEIACDLILEKGLGEADAVRTLALLNMAEMDAAICCWDAKYHYYLMRPWMVDPAITTPVGQPNFPTYTSGHSTFSGAASTVLGSVFPDKKTQLDAMAQEASNSRIYGGIHYRFDCTTGITAGNAIGKLAIERGQRNCAL